jgi:RNA polymerase sigma-70 factor (ECF subfamily)
LAEGIHQLVARCLAGDESAMAALVDRYRSQVFGLCFRMLGHRQDAEDAAQESFVRLLRSLARWDPARGFEPWLLAIAGNRCRTMLAVRRRRPAPHGLVEPVDATPDGRAAGHLAEELRLALAELREEYRRAFTLFHEQELSYAQIAAVLDCPLGTVKTWVHRARRELIERLRQRGVIEEPRHAVRSV